MAEARVPEEDFDWTAVDIFLFSNGQQYSPPRKYHLKSEELSAWSSTLNFLAQSQLGFKHSKIELYTIDGIKVNTPLELSNGTAYVAVEPPDAFIPAGYEKYLMKASRSWEKRQTRKPNGIEVSNADNGSATNDNLQSKINTNLTNNEIACYVGSKGKVCDENRSGINAQHQTDVIKIDKVNNVDNIAPMKNTLELNTINKKILGTLPIIRRLRKRDNLNRDKLTINGKNKESSTSEDSFYPDINSKSIHKQKIKSGPITTVKKVEKLSLQPIMENSIPSTKLNESKCLTTDDIEVSNIIDNKDIVNITNIYKNLTEEEIPSILLETYGKSLGHTIYQTVQNKGRLIADKNVSKNSGKLYKLYSKVNVFQNKILQGNPSLMLLSNTQKSTEPETFMAIVKRGDVINLKLRIEISSSETTKTQTEIPKSQSLTNIITEEKEIVSDKTVVTPSNTMVFDSTREDIKYPDGEKICDVIILQGCCNNCNPKDGVNNNPNSVEDNNKILIIIPENEVRQNSSRCAACRLCEKENMDCKQNAQISNDEKVSTDKIETNLETPLEVEHTNKEQNNTEQTEDKINTNGSLKNVNTGTSEINQPEFIITKENFVNCNSCNIDKNPNERLSDEIKEYVVTQSKPGNINENTDDHPEFILAKQDSPRITEKEEVNRTEFLVIKKINVNKSSEMLDKSTQTDYDCVLLEVRCHEDDRYTFHLPSIEMLKRYNL